MKKIRFIVVALLAMILTACGGEKESAPPGEDKTMMETTAEKVEKADEKMEEILDEVETEEVMDSEARKPEANEEASEEETDK